jgi:hypothetical protein
VHALALRHWRAAMRTIEDMKAVSTAPTEREVA